MNHSRAIKNRTDEIRRRLDALEAKMLAGDWSCWRESDYLMNSMNELDWWRSAQWRKSERQKEETK